MAHTAIATTASQLVAAAGDATIGKIVISSQISDVPTFRLAPDQSLEGADDLATITFAGEAEGIQLSSNNRLHNLRLHVAPERRAIFNDTSVETLGELTFSAITTTGRVQLLARDRLRSGHVSVNGLDIQAADARGERDRPHGYGVDVLQGAFTLWNMQPDEEAAISADLVGLTVGRDGAPVLGSGVFVSGAGDTGGRLNVRRLETGAIYSDGKIASGTADQISGGVFTVYGAHVEQVRNHGPVVTYGQNDMVLDNWGVVEQWIADGPITSHGPSGIGFVNFGVVKELRVTAPIETFGRGARGFNVYTGTVHLAEFERIVTHADGAVGVQISQPVGSIIVRGGIETFGGTGPSLVKGVMTTLSAIGLSIKPGGSAKSIEISGGLKTNGAGVAPIEQHGTVERLSIEGGCVAAGGGFDQI
ncbi:MAG TPA: hypothetical protein VFS83_08645 [Ktedonobacterales bacterium]|nr:hypothetical protein [Ktedonobacterales bacterium]